MKNKFEQGLEAALANPNIAQALDSFSTAYMENRRKAFEGIDFEDLRERVVEIKGGAAGRLNELAEQFKLQAEARGAMVFRTSEPKQVNDYIVNLAKERGVELVVKSKSMASEEIHLNSHLEEAGIEVRETDLGEWIVQLAGQRPSHMVLPAIHMKKEEVADIFSRELKEELPPDIPKLVETARLEMRGKFLTAGMGITGANIAMADTGTLAIVTNEGNARLVTTLPKIHVAIVGLEKLIQRFKDAAPILRALPRSATAQQLTSYVTFITGQTPNTDGSDKELHIILMDNRRSEMADDPVFKEALQCIRCASCLNVCPVYRLVGGHVFGDIYTGGIGAILTAWFDELKQSDDIQGLCIQCGRCVDVCPGKIDIPELIVELRRRIAKENPQPIAQRTIFSVVGNRSLFHKALWTASKAQKPFADSDGLIRHLPLFFNDMVKFRSLPAIADKPLRDQFETLEQPNCDRRAIFYAGCLIDFAYPGTGEAVVKTLNAAKVQVLFPQGQTCCGAPARYAGDYKTAIKNAKDNIDALDIESVDYVVSACPTCTVALKNDFEKTLADDPDWLSRAKSLSDKVMDYSSLILNLRQEGRIKLGGTSGDITYHDSCHLKRTLNAESQPRELLTGVGYKINEMAERDVCCGMGGSYTLKFPQISAPILAKKLDNIEATSTPMVAMDCPGCMMQIRGGLDKRNSQVKVAHTAELLAKLLEKSDSSE